MTLTERRYHHRTTPRSQPEVPVGGKWFSQAPNPIGADRQNKATNQHIKPNPTGEDEAPILQAERSVLVLQFPHVAAYAA